MDSRPMAEVMRTEVIADCYCGPDCDQVQTRFRSYCEGDMEADTHTEDVVIRLADLPAGATITVCYPCCPECGTPREDQMENLDGGRMKIAGHKGLCDCGFDWNNWIVEKYS